MKRLFFLFLLIPLSGFALAQTEVKDQVVGAIATGNAAALGRTLIANVDLTLPGISDHYSKAQAEQILKKFFEDQQPQGLTIEHEGNSSMGDHYYIGHLRTMHGEYRVTFFLKRSNQSFAVKQLRIENANKDR